MADCRQSQRGAACMGCSPALRAITPLHHVVLSLRLPPPPLFIHVSAAPLQRIASVANAAAFGGKEVGGGDEDSDSEDEEEQRAKAATAEKEVTPLQCAM